METTLRDGTPVTVRKLGPEHRENLAEGYWRLSPDSRYQRFWVRTGEAMGEKLLDRMLDIDPQRHEVWAVTDRSREFQGVGAASYWRSKDNPDTAEFSCTVLDEDQRNGVGTLLLAVTWLAAKRVGVKWMEGYTMPENKQAIHWLRDFGAETHWDGYKSIFRWSLDDLETIPPTKTGIELAERLAEFAGEIL